MLLNIDYFYIQADNLPNVWTFRNTTKNDKVLELIEQIFIHVTGTESVFGTARFARPTFLHIHTSANYLSKQQDWCECTFKENVPLCDMNGSKLKSTTAGRDNSLTVFLPTTSSQTHQKPSVEPTTNLPPGVFNPTALITSCKQVYWPWGGTTFSSPFISTLIFSRMAPDTADLSVLLSVACKQNTSDTKWMERLRHGWMEAAKHFKTVYIAQKKTCCFP